MSRSQYEQELAIALEQEFRAKHELELRATHGQLALRDQFAAAALTGLLAGGREYHGEEARASLALYAYACADAMLTRRAIPPSKEGT